MREKANLVSRLQCVLLLLVVARTAAAGGVIYVDADAVGANNGSSWENAYFYLQDALADANAAEKPVEIRVAQGIYKPDQGVIQTPGDHTATFQLINGVTLKGGYGGFSKPDPDAQYIDLYKTILSGDLNGNDIEVADPIDMLEEPSRVENSYHVVTGSGTNANAVLDGFTIIGGGNADTQSGDKIDGGGMYNREGSPTITNCTFSSNQAVSGGGMCNYIESSPTLTNCTFIGNSANQGAGMWNFGECSPTLTNCTFSGNHATNRGGGLGNREECNPTLTNCKIIGNAAGEVGGGRGGGIFSADICNPVLINCIIADNFVIGNSNEGYGGGICYWNYRPYSSLTLINCTFARNSAPSGNALACYSKDRSFPMILRVINCILWDSGNQIWNDDGSVIGITYSDVQGGWSGQGNINTNPLFVDADGADNIFGTEDDDLRLLPDSPCIDAGDNTAVPVSVVVDLNGNPRIINGMVDMGAYEGGKAPPVKVYYIDVINGDDDNDGLTPEAAFATIQSGIDAAADGEVVLVYPGLYQEEINFLGKALTVQGVVVSPDGVPVIQNPGDFAVSFYYGEGPDSILKNFIIKDSFMGVFIADSSPAISNLTIVGNKYGIEAYADSKPDISNTILWNNTDGDLFGCQARYSFVQQVSEPLEGLISYWKFDEDQGSIAYDSAGDNHGTIHGAQRTAGQVNGALSFDGEDDYVALPDNSPIWLPQFNFSFTAWVYFERESISLLSEGEVILDLNFGDSSDTANELGYNIHRSGESRRLYFQMTTTTNSDENLYSNEVLAANRWYHLVAVREGGTQAIYVNGFLDGSRTCSADPIDFVDGYDDDRINIGRFTTNIGHPRYHLKGKIDDVMIFDRALSAEEIQQLYQGIYEFATNPLFADPANGDYHLRSERGRYWPEYDIWVLDKVTSPCVDGGDPNADTLNEPLPHGNRINIGAYGGTMEASLSPSEQPCPLSGKASNPYPADGAVDVEEHVSLTWTAGLNAVSHDVYFGTDRDAVANADTSDTTGIYRGRQAITSYTPREVLSWHTAPYYWRIDEYNPDATISMGGVWSFTVMVADYLIVEDFESYDDSEGNHIWFAWHDGIGYGVPGFPPFFTGNGTGAAVGDEATNSYTEESIVHGGGQSMPFSYNNNKQGFAYYSETYLTLIALRDWTNYDGGELSIWFRGYPEVVGSFVEGPVGTYTMTGSGADILNRADEFHFAYKTLTGAGSIVAKVVSVDNTNVWAKAGVMIRETLNPDSAHAMMVVTPSSGVSFQRRRGKGGTSVRKTTAGSTAPYWMKIERDLAGNFTAYSSADGSTWQMLGFSEPIQMGANVYIGLAVTSHDVALTCQAVFSNITTTGSVGPQWASQDIGIASNDAEPLYVAVSNSAGAPAVVVHDDPAVAQIATWTEWVIPLQAFADQGIDLANVDRIAIGLGTKGNIYVPGGAGKMFIDDIGLYRSGGSRPKTF